VAAGRVAAGRAVGDTTGDRAIAPARLPTWPAAGCAPGVPRL